MERKGKVAKGRRKGCFGMFYTKSYNCIKKKDLKEKMSNLTKEYETILFF